MCVIWFFPVPIFSGALKSGWISSVAVCQTFFLPEVTELFLISQGVYGIVAFIIHSQCQIRSSNFFSAHLQ